MKTKRIISLLLAVLTIMGSLVITVGATDAEKTYEYTNNTTNTKPTIDYIAGVTIPEEEGVNGVAVNTAEKKLATMDLKLAKDGYLLYIDQYSGEIAVICEATGESLFSNPYNVGSSNSANTDDIRGQILSQLVVYYQDLSTGSNETYYSYEWCASLGQVDVKNIKNGIRVEYAIGREEARMLVPGAIKKETFEAKILTPLAEVLADEGGVDAYKYKKIREWYRLYDPQTMDIPEDVMRNYPVLKKMSLYVLDSAITGPKKAILEQDIKTYCPEYSYEDLDADHLEAEYESEDKDPPLFKMALEYTLDKYGLSVRLPANGIRFNESLYQLEKIEVLPFMGAGCNYNPGYTFYPDGSGAIFDFETIKDLGMPVTIGSKIYGEDFAYHSITMKHEETIRYPVFGLVETQTSTVKTPVPTTPPATDGSEEGSDTPATAAADTTIPKDTKVEKDRGYVAIVEEGDALMRLEVNHAGKTNVYNTVKMAIYPRPKDTYNIADAISVGSNSTWTVVSSRKYTGNYKIRYIMLTDTDVAAEKGITDFYECTYVGMAKAYRNFLEDQKILTRLTSDDVKSDIPLYIETFGAVMTTERILSVPVTTMVPLTSFDNIKTMYEDLSAKGVTNVNFILNGYTKGGISDREVPYHLKWEKAVGGKSGFEDLVAYAKEKDFGIFPDVDFAFIDGDGLFDGVSLKKHAVKTIDNRYTSKRVYSATKQAHMSYYEMAISPAYFSRFYEKFTENYLKYDPVGISVSSLGTYLNSDFDEDEPFNRGDAVDFTSDAFEYLDNSYGSVMTSGGNSFTWKYVDHIRDIALDSSRFAQCAASVPFIGMVLHGYVQISGTPINMEGNTDYALLKAIENGASINFLLSYQNTDILKESPVLSQYYSVRYDIWFNDVVDMYSELNAALKGVQTSLITDHQFIIGERIPDEDELMADSKAAVEEAIRIETELRDAKSKEEQEKLLEARKGINAAYENAKQEIATSISNIEKIVAYVLADKMAAYEEKVILDALNAELAPYDTELADLKKKIDTYTKDIEKLEKKIADANTSAADLEKAKADLAQKQEALAPCVARRDEINTLVGAKIIERDAIVAANDIKTSTSDLAKLNSDLAKLEAELVVLKAELDSFQGTNVGSLAISKKESAIKSKENAIEAKKKEITAKQEEIDALKAIAEAAEGTYGKFSVKLPSDAAKGLEDLYTVYSSTYFYADAIAKALFNAENGVKVSNEYIKLLKESGAHTDAFLADLEAVIADTVEAVDELKALLDEAKAYADEAYDALKDHKALADYIAADAKKEALKPYEIPVFTEEDLEKPEEDEEITDGEETEGEETEGEESEGEDTEGEGTEKDDVIVDDEDDGNGNGYPYTKYTSDENKIVLVSYDNGTSFILNFNNYAVTAVVNGVEYTVNGYSYIMFTK